MRAAQARRGHWHAGAQEGMLEHGPRPVADQMAQIRRDDGLMALGRQHRVQRGEQVRRGVDQRSVEVENDGERHIRHVGWVGPARPGNSAGATGLSPEIAMRKD